MAIMNKNNQEIEIKIKITDSEALFRKALSLGGQELKDKEGLETDVMYDDGNGFFDSHKVLRIRTAPFGNLLTYKEKNQVSDNDNFLVRTEIETFIDDPKAMDLIIQKLGFVPHVTKQKYVRKIKIDDLILEFHKLPFIENFIEIEGEKNQIISLLKKLGLDESQGIGRDYSTLFFEFCDLNNLAFTTPQTFEQEKKFLAGKI